MIVYVLMIEQGVYGGEDNYHFVEGVFTTEIAAHTKGLALLDNPTEGVIAYTVTEKEIEDDK